MSLIWSILKRGIFTPRRIAVVDDRSTYSYFKVAAGSFFMARAIRRSTDRPHVGLMLPTSGAFPLALLGSWLARKTPVPINYLLRPEELAYVIKDSGIDTLITVGKLLDHVGGEEAMPEGVKIIKLEEQSFKGIPPLCRIPRPANDDTAVLLYTSGTSGKPKGVMLTHGNLQANVTGIAQHAEGLSLTTFLGVLPQFHSFGLTALTLWPLSTGRKAVYTARFMPKKILELIREHRPEVFVAVPSMYNAFLSLKNATREDFASLSFPICGGEPLPAAVAGRLEERFGLSLLEGYGLTETSPVTNCNVPHANKPSSVGKPLFNVKNIIVDDQEQLVATGGEGEILICGPSVMKGYYELPDQTRDAFTELEIEGQPRMCFRTGDIGKIDEDGYLFITGRKKEMLIVSGENVFPREIEEALNQHPSVRDSAVIGMQDESRGEVPIAFVELEEDVELDEAGIRSFVRERIAPFKVPREIRAVEALPRNPTGKIMRRELQV